MFTFKVLPDDGEPFDVVARSRDISLWERTHKGRTLKGLEASFSMAMMEELAVVAARRQNLYTGNLVEFRDTCDFEVEQDEAEEGDEGLDPTRPGP